MSSLESIVKIHPTSIPPQKPGFLLVETAVLRALQGWLYQAIGLDYMIQLAEPLTSWTRDRG